MQAANVEKAVEQLKSEGLDVDGMVRKLSSSDHCLIVGGTNKNDHHHQPSLNSYFALRSAMLESRRTEALCWNPQSKGGHFGGKHCCSRYFEHNLQFKPFPRWGGLDILVSNAAVNPYFGPTLGCPEEVGK